MMMRHNPDPQSIQFLKDQRGFSLIELVIAMVVAGIVIAGIVAAQTVQQRSYRTQTMVINTQQNLRSAFHRLQNELLMAGYDRLDSGEFGLINVARINDNSAITFSGDFGPGTNMDNGTLDAGETISFFLFNSPDTPGSQTFDLARRVDGGAATLLAEGIEAMGFAYAFDDSPRDGRVDFVEKGGATDMFGFPIQDLDEHYIWAIDTDGDGFLDTSLDVNQDGLINADDGTGGTPLAANVDIARVRGIKIWLLARTRSTVLGKEESQTYWVAGRKITRFDGRERRLLTATLMFRNMGS